MYSKLAILSLCASYASAHGILQSIQGANGVTMPGLSVKDGVPRDCSTPTCGSEEDTSVINDNDFEPTGPLGRNADGVISPETNMAIFMGTSSAKRDLSSLLAGAGGAAGATGATGATGGAGYGGGYGGGAGYGSSGADGAGASNSEGTKTPAGTTEDIVAKTAGQGKTKGLPTAGDDGTIKMTFHQVNQDGAGPLEAGVDSTSGGKDASAFKQAQVTKDVPGLGFGGGISGASTTDFPVEVKMDPATTCDGEVSGVKNVCIVRVRNGAGAGPFGGSAAFTQSKAGRKRAIAYRMKMKRQLATRGN